MHHHIIEIKAYCDDLDRIRDLLPSGKTTYKGNDHQTDTYFKVPYGRLKLREGTIENHLIHYLRNDQQGPKKSDVLLFRSDPGSNLKEVLTRALGTLVVVDKYREIYFVDNVKIHLDKVMSLGTFVEIEAIGSPDGPKSIQELDDQCRHFLELFGIPEKDLIANSYSDLLLEQ